MRSLSQIGVSITKWDKFMAKSASLLESNQVLQQVGESRGRYNKTKALTYITRATTEIATKKNQMLEIGVVLV